MVPSVMKDDFSLIGSKVVKRFPGFGDCTGKVIKVQDNYCSIQWDEDGSESRMKIGNVKKQLEKEDADAKKIKREIKEIEEALGANKISATKKVCVGGIEAAEAYAKDFLRRGSRVDTKDMVEALRCIGEWPKQCRPNVAPGGVSNPMVEGLVLGLAPNRQGSCAISQGSLSCPHFTKLVTTWAKCTLPDPSFRFGSIQINHNYAAKKHIDSNNLGPSFIISMGQHTGGKLWTGDRGVIDCKNKWKLFDGNTEHYTQPFTGNERFSIILFTPDAYNKLNKQVYTRAKELGLTAIATDGIDDDYFSQYRDLGAVDEDKFDDFISQNQAQNPPRQAPGAITVECNGYAAGRGFGYIAWMNNASGLSDEPYINNHGPDAGLLERRETITIRRFKKNQTGLHVVQLEVSQENPACFKFISVERFNLYSDTISESDRWFKWVKNLPENRIVTCCITDTAMAKTRPLPKKVYDALRILGAPPTLTLIGYREPFCFIGWKGAETSQAVYALDPKKQSKQLLRIDGIMTTEKSKLKLTDVNLSETKLLKMLAEHRDDTQLPGAKKQRTSE